MTRARSAAVNEELESLTSSSTRSGKSKKSESRRSVATMRNVRDEYNLFMAEMRECVHREMPSEPNGECLITLHEEPTECNVKSNPSQEFGVRPDDEEPKVKEMQQEREVPSAENFESCHRPYQERSSTNAVGVDVSNQGLTDALYHMASSISQGQHQIPTFDGDALDYHRFIEDYDDVYGKMNDKISTTMKLKFLIELCTGKAHGAIKSCKLIKPARQGYSRARQILREQFGQEFQVANSHMKLLKEGPVIRAGDTEALYYLSTQMHDCYVTLTQWNRSAELNNQETMEKIFLRFPKHMQYEFQKRSMSHYDHGREPTFLDMLEYIQQVARMGNTRFGQLLSKSDKRSKDIRVPDQKRGYGDSKMALYSTQTKEVITPKQHGSKSVMCDKDHKLWKCDEFLKMSTLDRTKYVQNKGLCFNCLSPGHMARACKSEGRCRVNGCGKCHHTLLHKDANEFSQPKKQAKVTAGSTEEMLADTLKRVRLKVVPVEVWYEAKSQAVQTYAFLDEVSNATLCTYNLMKRLRVKGKEDTLSISTVNGQQMQKAFKCHLVVRGINKPKAVSLEDVYAVPSLPTLAEDIPSQDDVSRYSYLNGIHFPKLDVNEVELLVGRQSGCT